MGRTETTTAPTAMVASNWMAMMT
ncbi:hypothetical protein A2U01_0106138, partial [Trifolium medium]|nr:hypothetical protein [Trifolium medium]